MGEDKLEITMKVEDNRIIFTVDGGQPDDVNLVANFLATGMNVLTDVTGGEIVSD